MQQVKKIYHESIQINGLQLGINRFQINCPFLVHTVRMYIVGSLRSDLAVVGEYTLRNLSFLDSPDAFFSFNRAGLDTGGALATLAGSDYMEFHFSYPKKITNQQSMEFRFTAGNAVDNTAIAINFEFEG